MSGEVDGRKEVQVKDSGRQKDRQRWERQEWASLVEKQRWGDDHPTGKDRNKERGTGTKRVEKRQTHGNKQTHREQDKIIQKPREFVCWLLNIPATCQCISGTDLLSTILHADTLR